MENSELFKGAKFGDKFMTSDGRCVIYLRMFICNGVWYHVSDGTREYPVRGDGSVDNTIYPGYPGIVSHWKEPIDEKKLSELAEHEFPKPSFLNDGEFHDSSCYSYISEREAFKRGYCKAKEE